MAWLFLLLAAICGISAAQPLLNHPDWLQFKVDHGKTYGNENEEAIRNGIFLENLNKVNEHNKLFEKGLTTYTLKMNQFGDLTAEEFKATLKGLGPLHEVETPKVPLVFGTALPGSVDWRSRGAVTPVKDQGSCGSCWAFSTTGTLEGQLFLKTGQLVSLSEQNLVDCAVSTGNYGCSGGWPNWGIDYVSKAGIDTEAAYSYNGWDGSCKFTKEGALLAGAKPVLLSQSEDALKEAVANIGPVSICIDAGHSSFQLYGSATWSGMPLHKHIKNLSLKGVYYEQSCSTDELDHAVLAVGYGTENGHDYWLVKNSWGASWGDSGYIRMSRNKSNNCGVASHAVYPVLA